MTALSHVPFRGGAALIGVAGVVALAACSSAGPEAADELGEYADGAYTADGTYQTPETLERVTVSLTLQDGVITDVDVEGDPQARESEQFQAEFIGGISDEVVGKHIDEISVRRVAGSSLTSGGFNQAVDDIKHQASS